MLVCLDTTGENLCFGNVENGMVDVGLEHS